LLHPDNHTFTNALYDATPFPPRSAVKHQISAPVTMYSMASFDAFSTNNASNNDIFSNTPSMEQISQNYEAVVNEVPLLIKAVGTLLNCLPVEPPHTHTICLEALFKIAMYFPSDHKLSILIRDEIHHIAASGFCLNYPLMSTHHNSSESFGFSTTWECLDDRSILKKHDLLGFDNPVEHMIKHPNDRNERIVFEDNGGSSYRDAALYSLALESLATNKNSLNKKIEANNSSNNAFSMWPPLDTNTNNSSFNMLGDIITSPTPISHATEAPVISNNSKYLVEGEELRILLHQVYENPVN
jgi:hypothetical protein